MSQSAESQDQKGPSRDQQAKSESEMPSDRAGGAGEPLDKANVASGSASGSAPPAAGRRRARKGRGKSKGGQASAASTNNAEGDGSPQPSAAAESAPKEEGKRPGRRRTRRNKRKGDSGQTATSREPSTKRSESQSRGRSTSRLPPCHADKWLVSRAPICSKGGQRQIDSPGDESDSIEIRDSPYLVCLHRIKPDKGAAVIRVYVDIFDRESKDFVKGKESIVLHEYVVYVQGPFLGYEAGEEHKMIWDSDGTGKENLLRISHAQNICVWDLTDPEGDAAVESPYGRELCISFNAFSEAYAINFVEALEDHLLGIYYRTEASRLSELASGMTGKKKFDAKKLKEKSHSLAAEHIFAFFNRNRSLFEIDLHHLRVTGKEAESRLIRKVRQVQETEVDSMQQEKYLEVSIPVYIVLYHCLMSTVTAFENCPWRSLASCSLLVNGARFSLPRTSLTHLQARSHAA